MGFFRKTKESIISDAFKLVEVHAGLQSGIMYDISLYDDHLTIKIPLGKEETTLNYNQITDVFYGVETEVVNTGKSVIGRAIAGGILFGGVGAVVGGMSGAGTKQKKEHHTYFIISYRSSAGNDEFIQFEDTRMYKGSKVAAKLKELCGIGGNRSL